MKKILLTSGDSFTDKNWTSEMHPDYDTSYPKWPEILADKLGMENVNLGKGGSGNEYIYTSLLEYITNPKNSIDDIGLVVPAWSQIQRKDYQQGQSGRWVNTRIDPHGDAYSLSNRSLKFYLSFQILCERYNINYHQVQMINFHHDLINGLSYGHGKVSRDFSLRNKRIIYPYDKIKDTNRVLQCILEYEKRINTDKFIGWPIAEELGGFTLCSNGSPIFMKHDRSAKVSEYDAHPNKKGHEMIAEYIYDRLG